MANYGLGKNAPNSNLPPFDIKLKKGEDPKKRAQEIAAYGERSVERENALKELAMGRKK